MYMVLIIDSTNTLASIQLLYKLFLCMKNNKSFSLLRGCKCKQIIKYVLWYLGVVQSKLLIKPYLIIQMYIGNKLALWKELNVILSFSNQLELFFAIYMKINFFNPSMVVPNSGILFSLKRTRNKFLIYAQIKSFVLNLRFGDRFPIGITAL